VQRLRHKEDTAKRSKSRILKAATKCFVQHGFSGTSLGDIAKKIGINQSLIYHYFSSKEELWKVVKEDLLREFLEASRQSFDVEKGLRSFLNGYLHGGYDHFRRHPDVVKIMSWQSLESDSSIEDDRVLLKEAVEKLQQKKELRNDLDSLVVVFMIKNVMRAPFFDDYAAFDSAQAQKYLDLAVDGLYKALKP